MLETESYYATVIATNDPEKRGRIKVACAAITGSDEVALLDWVEPVFDWGWFLVPDVNELVELEAIISDEYGEETAMQAFLEDPRFRWRSKRFEGGEEGTAARPPPEIFTATNYGKRRGFATPKGHVIMFDDTDDAEQLTISWKNAAGEVAILSFDAKGSAVLGSKIGSLLYMDAEHRATTLVDSQEGGSNMLVMDGAGIRAIDKFSNIVELKDGVIQILSQKALTINAGSNCTVQASDAVVKADKVEVDSPEVLIGTGANSPFVRHTEWEAWAKTHTHPTGLGPSGAPLVPPTPAIASTTAKVK